MRTYRHIIAAGIAALVLALAAPLLAAPAHAVDDVMTQERAGDYYMTHACRYAEAADRFDRKVWGDKDSITNEEVRRRLNAIQYETARYASKAQRWATKLLNPPALWPTEIGDLPDRLAMAHIKRAGYLRRASGANSAPGWGYWVRKAWGVKFGNYAATIRAGLNLPAPGKGC